MNAESTVSQRVIQRLGLPLLSTAQAINMINSKAESFPPFKLNNVLCDTQNVRDKVVKMLALLSGGHPRTVERICAVLCEKRASSMHDVVADTAAAILAKYNFELNSLPVGLLIDVLASVPVPLYDLVSNTDSTFDRSETRLVG